jgi:murein DD-endopeptidase MepM/ murein hydrolase activator NlpD
MEEANVSKRHSDAVLVAGINNMIVTDTTACFCYVFNTTLVIETLYSHQSRNKVKKGDKVKAGQVIGLTGRTGRATTEHLHFEVSFDGKRLDPAIIFDHSNHKLKAATLHLTKGKGVKSVKN